MHLVISLLVLRDVDLIVSVPDHCLSFYFAGRTCHLVGFVMMRLIIGVLMCVLVC